MDELNKTAATKPETRPEAAKLQDAPRRRVGSLTMGACLIAAGIFFLCYYFVPGFDWQLVVRIAPAAALVLLGCEVLFFAARPGRWKYDFVSVLVCLGLIAVCMCLSFLPMVWSEIDPARGQNEMKLSKAYTTQVYEALRKENPDLRLRDVYTDLYLYANSVDDLQELQPGDGHLSLTVMLYGPYDSTGAFAQDCRSVAGTVRAGTLQPDELRIVWSPDNDPGQSLDSGTLQRVEQYTLELDGTVQLDWTADEMERQVEVQYLMDEENEPEEDTAPSEEAEPEAAVYSQSRGRELWESFEKILGVCEDERTDLLLIAGDLFHRQPLVRELKEVNYLFSELTATKVVLIAGNHDHLQKDSNYRSFEWNDNVYPLFGKKLEYVDFPELETAVYGLSYYEREICQPLYDDVAAAGIEKNEILLAHGGDDRHIPFDKKKLSRSGFSYIALGHIHKPQALQKDKMIYAGALEPIDQNDVGQHGYVKGELKDGKAAIQWIPFAGREYIHSSVEVERSDTEGSIRKRVKQLINEYGNENIYKITLAGKRDPDIAFEVNHLAEEGCVLEILDETIPAYDFEKLYAENKETLLGRYIEKFAGCEEGSVEYCALCEGVEALLTGNRG